MTLPTGTNLGGIRTLEDLRQRCRIDEINGCWHFGRALRESTRAPCVRLPALDHEMVSLGVAIGFLTTGKRPAKGTMWHITCGTRLCANPEHRKAGTRATQMQACGYKPTPKTVARIARTKRSKSSLSEEDIAAIRASDAPLSELAERYGKSMAQISRIRLGQLWRPLQGASVFTLGAK
jgi:hypothetical protein